MALTFGLLECDQVAERFRQISGGYREMFGALFQRHPEIELRFYDVCHSQFPDSIDACDAYLTTGSRFSVYDDLDWIHSLKGFVRRLHDARKPFVGICFGHQLLADALGGEVTKSANGWGVGVHSVEVIREESWMQPARSSCNLQYLHQDQVQRLPEGGVLLGSSDHCPVAIFRVGETMLGIQAHPEFTAAYSQALLIDRASRIGSDRVETALASLNRQTDQATIADWIGQFIGGR